MEFWLRAFVEFGAHPPRKESVSDRRSSRRRRGRAGLAGLAAAVYQEPFWRQEGLSGFAVNDSGPLTVVYDDCPEDGSPGVLVGFIEGEQARIWARRAPADRRAGILACLVDFFGERSGRPRELLEHSWADGEYSGGCYTGYFPPGVWTSFGDALREPIGRLHWAGTETATAWTSYMEGAVQSGERAADEVLAAS